MTERAISVVVAQGRSARPGMTMMTSRVGGVGTRTMTSLVAVGEGEMMRTIGHAAAGGTTMIVIAEEDGIETMMTVVVGIGRGIRTVAVVAMSVMIAMIGAVVGIVMMIATTIAGIVIGILVPLVGMAVVIVMTIVMGVIETVILGVAVGTLTRTSVRAAVDAMRIRMTQWLKRWTD